MEGFDIRFQVPSNMIIMGPTSSGKTTWLKNLIQHKNTYFATEPKIMILFYKEHQKRLWWDGKIINDGKTEDQNFPVFKNTKICPRALKSWRKSWLSIQKNPEIVVFWWLSRRSWSGAKAFVYCLDSSLQLFHYFYKSNVVW